MTMPIQFEPRAGYLYVRFAGEQELAAYQEALPRVLAECQRLGLAKMLVDLGATTGHLDTQNKFDLGVLVAGEAANRFKLAILVSQADRDDRFFENVAANRGAWIKDFTDQAAALAWLLGQPQ